MTYRRAMDDNEAEETVVILGPRVLIDAIDAIEPALIAMQEALHDQLAVSLIGPELTALADDFIAGDLTRFDAVMHELLMHAALAVRPIPGLPDDETPAVKTYTLLAARRAYLARQLEA